MKKFLLTFLISLVSLIAIGGVIFVSYLSGWGATPDSVELETPPSMVHSSFDWQPHPRRNLELPDVENPIFNPLPEPEPCRYELMTAELKEFMTQFGDTVSVHFENLESGFTFAHYGERVFFGASATKAPFAFYIYMQAERGATNLNAIMTFTESDFWEGSGIIRHNYEYGATFSQRRLLHLMLSPSDNIATRILRRHHGLNGYRAFIEELGGNPWYIQNLTYSYLSANEAGFYLREFYRYIVSDSLFGHEFKANLMANRYPFIIADYPLASKSGWAANFGGAWHDMAIIFAPSPYSLALLSSLNGNTTADRDVYNSISMFMQDFNSRWFYQDALQ